MDFPALVPSSRQFTSGQWPMQTFKAMDGYEVRLLFGNKQTGMKLELGYDAIPDTDAELFIRHYEQQLGGFTAFAGINDAKKGWAGDPSAIGADTRNNHWRYDGPPQVTNVRPGVSNVRVSLVAVLI